MGDTQWTPGDALLPDNASQQTCTLSHLPAKTPLLTLRYATRDDPAGFVTLAAQLLQCLATQQSNTSAATQLPGMVSRLVDIASVFQPPSSSSSAGPASTDADLVAWDCSDHLMHVHCLLQLVNRITILAHYHVGGFLRQVMATARATTVSWWRLPTLPAPRTAGSTRGSWLVVGTLSAPLPFRKWEEEQEGVPYAERRKLRQKIC